MADFLEYLNILDDIIQDARGVPFSGKVSVSKEEIENIIDNIKDELPFEIKQAQKILDNHDRIIDDAKSKAADIIEEANRKAKELMGEHEVYKLAKDAADKQADEAKKYSREMRIGTMNYVDDILTRTEDAVREALEDINNGYRLLEKDLMETVNRLYENKQEIRGETD